MYSEQTIANIKKNYGRLEKKLVNELFFETTHGGTIGHYREKIWSEMFEMIVPKKFVIEQSVFIIDSEGNVSNEVDLAIYDETYTPYVFQYGEIKFIPVEAVVAVVECKSKSMKKDGLIKWAKSIKELKTSNRSFVRIFDKIACGEKAPTPTQSATRPLRILCCLNHEYKDLIEENESSFDIVIRAESDKLRIEWDEDKNKKTLYDWYMDLNHAQGFKGDKKKGTVKDQKLEAYKVYKNGNELSLMTFNFQFNQVLMLINNPMLFPHIAYAQMFNKKGEKDNE